MSRPRGRRTDRSWPSRHSDRARVRSPAAFSPHGIEASKEKTRTERSGMLSTRLGHLLEMRQLDPAGQPWPGEAYIFGDELGRLLALATIRDRWTALVARVGLAGLQLRDMRHEGANRLPKRPGPRSPTCRSCSGIPTSPRRPAICETSGPHGAARGRPPRSCPGRGRGARDADGASSASPVTRMGRRNRAHTDEGPTGRERDEIRGRKYHKMPHLGCLQERGESP